MYKIKRFERKEDGQPYMILVDENDHPVGKQQHLTLDLDAVDLGTVNITFYIDHETLTF